MPIPTDSVSSHTGDSYTMDKTQQKDKVNQQSECFATFILLNFPRTSQ